MQEIQSLGWEDPLQEEMVTHSNILSWKIPWTEEPGRLQSIGLLRVRHDWSSLAHTHSMFYSLGFTFRSMICFELSFMYDVRYGLSFLFFFLPMDIQLFLHHLLKRLILFHKLFFHFSKMSMDHTGMVLFLDSVLLHWATYLYFYWYHIVLITVEPVVQPQVF